MRVTSVESTDLFVGTQVAPCQVVRVHLLLDPGESSGLVTLAGTGVQTAQPGIATGPASRGAEVAVTTEAPPGTRVPVRVLAEASRS